MSTHLDPITVPDLAAGGLGERPSADGGGQVATHGEQPSFEQAASTISTPELVNTGSAASELDDGDNESEASSTVEFSASHLPAAFDAQAVVEEDNENGSVDGSAKGVTDDASGLEVMSVISDSGEPGETDTQ
jgi:hypothetical protein